MKTMKAARLHEIATPMVIESVPVPVAGAGQVLVQVKACGIVPNLRNVLAFFKQWFPYSPLPKLPATFGLDVTGVIAAIGEGVNNVAVGDRVYVNPVRGCGSCKSCRAGKYTHCQDGIFQGYFGFGPKAQALFDQYPDGGLAEFSIAPQYALVRLPDTVSFESAVRLGYIGTAYAGLRKANVGPGDTLLINGISGTLGLGAAVVALAMGVSRILGTGRSQELLDKVKALAPSRIEVHSLNNGSIHEWVRGVTNDVGADVIIDCVGPGTPPETMVDAIYAARRGATFINVGGIGVNVSMDVRWMMDKQIAFIGSCWFNATEGQDLAEMARAGTLDLSIFENRTFSLSEVNNALESMPTRTGGFTNFVMTP